MDVLGFTYGSNAKEIFDEYLNTKCKRNESEVLSINPVTDSIRKICQISTTTSVPSHNFNCENDSYLREVSTVPILQLFGITQQSTSVLVNIFDIFPYIYFQCPSALINHTDILISTLDDLLKNSSRVPYPRILNVNIVYRNSILYFNSTEKEPYAQVILASPQLVSPLRSIIESGATVKLDANKFVHLPTQAFEANIPFELCVMADLKITGCSWIELPAQKYRWSENRISNCQIEVDCLAKDVIIHPPEGLWQTVAPLHIECVTQSGVGFPVPENDQVIQIASVLACHGVTKPLLQVVFCLNSCTAMPGVQIFWFETEAEMLLRWRDFFVACDPDIVTGYNSRLAGVKSKIKDVVLASRGLGIHENKSISLEGRVAMDMLEVIRRDFKLKSYSLNAVSAHFLKKQKEDVQYSMMKELFKANSESRRRIASYCLKDAVLPLNLMQKLLVLYNYVEMSRVTGTPLSFLLTRGQQIKVTSQLLRKCKELGYLFPTIRVTGGRNDEKAYEGATVLDPIKGLYKMPVATLDFASLYPSIMMSIRFYRSVAKNIVFKESRYQTVRTNCHCQAHNLCYSTLCVKSPQSLGLSEQQFSKAPSGSVFVKSSVRRGVLPLIVEDLIQARKRARKELADATDEMTKLMLDGRQLALKISANSVYGFTGAVTGGQLPCIEVSMAITAYGREMIDKTKSIVENHFTVKNNYPMDAKVIYGDTDSVMVVFGVKDIAKAMELGREAAAVVTPNFVSPIKLEFEKVFCPFLLMNKKRYAGLLYNEPTHFSKIDCKGIETVRRDFCLLVQQLVDTILKKLLIDQDEVAAQEYTRKIISELLQDRIDLSLLVMSKSLGKEEYAGKLAHVELAKKMKQRDPGSAPQIGDRVHFVIVPGVKGQAQYDRAEDPLYVLENNLTIDTQYYLDNIKNPVTRIFEGVMANPETLFSGTHTIKKKILTSASGGLSKFVKASQRCLGCRSIIKSGALCKHCEETQLLDIYSSKMNDLIEKEHKFSSLWVECQRCQGSLSQEVICTNRDCPIFYRRMKIKAEIDSAQNQVNKLSLNW